MERIVGEGKGLRPEVDLPCRSRRERRPVAQMSDHGFLYVVRHLVDRGSRHEEALIASVRDALSLNCIFDLYAPSN